MQPASTTTPGLRLSAHRERTLSELEWHNSAGGGLEAAPTITSGELHDPLTGLRSRVALLDGLDAALGEESGALVAVGLDGFARVNDVGGRSAGDRVLVEVARRLTTNCRDGDVVARLEGDRFAVVISGCDVATARTRAEMLIGSIEELISVDELSFAVSASAGIVDLALHRSGGDALESAVDALRRAKAGGRGRIAFASSPPVTPPAARTASGRDDSAVTLAQIDAAIASTTVVFQPIIAAATHELVGVEALARGPRGTRFEQPAALFATAETFGRLAELDLAAKRAAFAAGVPESVALFVNVDPKVLTDDTMRQRLIAAWQDSGRRGSVVVELTERSLVEAPGSLVRAIAHCRDVGWSIALDDIGARAETLTALRLVRPDIAKLDLRLVDRSHGGHAASVAVAVDAHRERWPIHVVAEGVETDEHERVARDLGATLMQGFKFGRPAPLDEVMSEWTVAPLGSGSDTDHVRVATKRHLLNVTRVVESMAGGAESIVLACLQSESYYTSETRRQYARLARRCGMTGVIGHQVTPGVRQGVHHGGIASDDPLVDEWTVVVLSADGGIALIARDLHECADGDGRDSSRLFSYEITRDPTKIESAANRLLAYF